MRIPTDKQVTACRVYRLGQSGILKYVFIFFPNINGLVLKVTWFVMCMMTVY